MRTNARACFLAARCSKAVGWGCWMLLAVLLAALPGLARAGGPDASLHGLDISVGTLSPPFASKTMGYTVSAASLKGAPSMTLTPNAASPCVISVNNAANGVGQPSAPIALTGKPQTIIIHVYAPPKSGCNPPCTRTAHETYMVVVNSAAPAPAPAPAPGPGFVPTDTDCVKWIKVNNLDSDDMPGDPMPIVDVSKTTATYSFKDDSSAATISSRSITPPAFGVWTNMLIGMQKAGKAGKPLQVVPLVDAPEGGRCHP